VQNNHTDSSCGFVVTKEKNSIFFTSDTFTCDEIWEEVNTNKTINSVVIDVSFPSRLNALGKISKHLTPEFLKQELLHKLKRTEIAVYINHLKPIYVNEIKTEIETIIDREKYKVTILKNNDVIDIKNNKIYTAKHNKQSYIEELNEVGHALTSEKNLDVLMDKILTAAKKLTNSDAGTFYLMSDDEKSLQFTAVQTDSLNFRLGGEHGKVPWPNLYLHDENGLENDINISVHCALKDMLINIPDVYLSTKYNFEGAKAFDGSTGYTTKSMLVVPMKNTENDVIGVLQLINKQDNDGKFCEFTQEDEKLILSMSSQAAVIVTNAKLTQGLEDLLEAFMRSIATAIGEKSKYTGGHINRVAELSMIIAKAINEDTEGKYKDIFFDEDELKELDAAAWMHDIGKITTPEYVVDKAKKLETIYDRIDTVKVKFELLKKEKELEFFKEAFTLDSKEKENIEKLFRQEIQNISEDFLFVEQMNTGGEFMSDDKIERIKNISKYKVTIDGETINILNENEVKNLCIRKGTLTEEERFIINNHAKVSYDMLASLPYPKKLRNVPQLAGGHHEKICGGGYPFGLKGDEISLGSRILAVADIFEALTASDRPYKQPNSLNTSMKILSFMAKDDELDRDLVKFFAQNALHVQYSKDNLLPDQLDEVTVNFDDL
jgi:HD-GYP domain-containing protein (c-di-GMP phosphodiesterase class II)